MRSSLAGHWPEYLIEAALLCCFMISVCFLIVMLESPELFPYSLIPSSQLRSTVLAFAIGATATLLIHSPWGKRSGAHLNPAVTLAFLLLNRVRPWDAVFYSLSQFAGATIGVLVVASIAGKLFTAPPILYATTAPGSAGELLAFLAEAIISFVLMFVILAFIRSSRLIRFTGVAIGVLIAIFIIVEAPLSGASMNPARTLASAIPAMSWQHIWIYLVAPPLGMAAAALIHQRTQQSQRVECAKLLHPDNVRCIHCGFFPTS